MLRNNRFYKGFTLIELLVVIGILAILLAIVLIAINPAKQFAQANDTKRRSDATELLNAIDQYAVDNNGTIPPGITSTAQNIGTSGVDLCSILTPKYLAQLPSDPTAGNPTGSIPLPCPGTYNTGYQVQIATGSAGQGRVTVTAPNAQTGVVIQVTR